MGFLRGVLVLGFGFVSLCLGYLWVLALAGVLPRRVRWPVRPCHRFAVVIPAHNEEAVLGRTLGRLMEQRYPRELYTVYVVSDHSTDGTAEVARACGAVCWERGGGGRRGKGAALAWAFERLLAEGGWDAVVLFDADSWVDREFLRVMDAMLAEGHRVIQGRHVIVNPRDGWMAALRYVALTLDNRLRNQGRSNLGFSCKLMGDAMCFAREVLEAYPWDTESLTEDAEYQSILLWHGVRVVYAPEAVSYGEAVPDWRAAGHQRARWMQGRAQVSRRWAGRLFWRGVREGDLARIDGAVERTMPSCSTLLMMAVGLTGGLWLSEGWGGMWWWMIGVWGGLVGYPLLGLVLERVPWWVWGRLVWVPVYVLWRGGVRLWLRLRGGVAWVRTPRLTEIGKEGR